MKDQKQQQEPSLRVIHRQAHQFIMTMARASRHNHALHARLLRNAGACRFYFNSVRHLDGVQ